MRNFLRVLLVLLLSAAPVSGAEVVVHAVGDIMLAGAATPILAAKGYDYPFGPTQALLSQSDILVGNLEAPISRGGREYKGKKFRFRARAEAASALKNAGFSVLTLANNHMMDFGEEALRQTRRHLSAYDIAFCGAGSSLQEAQSPAVVAVKGRRVAFLAYSLTQPVEFFAGRNSAGTAPGHLPLVRNDIRRVRSGADLVVVSFHWGIEGQNFPRERERQLARAAIDAGADAVLGHHPHVLQGVEFHKGKPILYSLGNYVFGSSSRIARLGMVGRIVFPDAGDPAVEIFPLNVWNPKVNYRPLPLQGKEARAAAREINGMCLPLGTLVEERAGRFFVAQRSR